MTVNIYLTARDGSYNASGIYTGENVIVKKGAKIRCGFASHIRGGRTAKSLRENPEIVSQTGETLQDCSFTSPSTAAQFVTGSSTNGWTAWHVDKKTSLRKYVDANERED